MLASSMPVTRLTFSTRCLTTYTAFTSTPRASAICRATRTAPVRLRSSAETMGRTFQLMVRPSLTLEIRSRRQPADAPRGIQPRGYRRNDCEDERGDDARRIHVRERLIAAGAEWVGVEHAQAPETERAEQEATQRAGRRDYADLGEMLQEDMA